MLIKVVRFITYSPLLIICLFGCGSISEGYPEGDFQVLVISDTHISNDTSKIMRLKKLFEKINQGTYENIAFLVNTGDIVSSVYKTYDKGSSRPQESRTYSAMQVFGELHIPFYWAMGNHDYKIDSDRDSDAPFSEDELIFMEKMWTELTGFRSFYAFTFRDWNFIILNTMHGRHKDQYFNDDQIDWFSSELKADRPVVLFFHHPLQTDNFRPWAGLGDFITPEVEPRFYRLLQINQEKIKGIFVGHGHFFIQDLLFGKINVYETGSFADNEDLPHLLIGFNIQNKRIKVAKREIDIHE